MKDETRFIAKRVGNVVVMAIGLVLLAVFYSLWYRFSMDRVLALVLLNVVYFPVFVLLLVSERRAGRLNQNYNTDYRLLRNVFTGIIICYGIFSVLPAYCAPVMIAAIFLTGVSTPLIGMAGTIYLDILLCVVTENGYSELAAYIFLSLAGGLIAIWLAIEKYRIYLGIIQLALSTVIPGLFYYFGTYEVNHKILIYSGIGGLVGAGLSVFLFDRTSTAAKIEIRRTLQEIIHPDFPLAKDIRNFSEIDYAHAQNVSQTAYQCALLIGADADIAAAAGFYYRLGKLEGEPFVENGVRLAENNCFPIPVIEILSEYNGEEILPQSKESAIVHMVDTVITKFELLDRDTVTNSWNQNVVVYQTLDEKSSGGIYDESGLSMNQYLKIREYLVKGVKLV